MSPTPDRSILDADALRLRTGGLDDATTIAALSVQVFLDTYATEGIRPDLAREAFREYSTEAFAARLAEPARRFLLAERESGLIGYAELLLAPRPAPAGDVVGSELVRLYIQPRFHRCGVGRRLLEASARAVASAGVGAVWLTAWDGNHRARSFYAAQGYRDVGATTFSFEGNSYPNRVLAVALDLRPGESAAGATVPPAIEPFWRTAVAALGSPAPARFYEAFHFDDNERSANELARLVLAGTKRATAGLLWSFEAEKKPLPKPGDLSVMTDWHGTPLCVIETRAVSIVPYEQVDEAFAATEGEGDGSLRHWREVHWAYLGRECGRIGRIPSPTMPVVCERFEVVYKQGD